MVLKLKIKLNEDGSVKTCRLITHVSNATKLEEPIGEDGVKASKKRGSRELDAEVQANKKQKVLDDRALSSQLRLLMEHQFGWMFSEPVDPVKLKIPDYFSVVSNPMDLGTIRSKLSKNLYGSADEFAADVRLTFSNAMRFKPPGNLVHSAAMELASVFEVNWKKTFGVREACEVDCTREISPPPQASSSTSVGLVQEKASVLVQPTKEQRKTIATPKALATEKMTTKKRRQKQSGKGSAPTVKVPGKGSAPIAASRGSITSLCLKYRRNPVSLVKDSHVTNTSGERKSKSDKPSKNALLNKELKATVPPTPPLPPEKSVRNAIRNCQQAETILNRAQHKKAPVHRNQADVISTEQLEIRQCQEKARTKAEMRSATRMKAANEWKQRRERERLELENMVCDFEEYDCFSYEADMVNVCGTWNLTRRCLHQLGLFLRNDDYVEDNNSEAMIMEELEEGEILTTRMEELEEGEIF